MPRYFDIRATVLIVVGHGLLPGEEYEADGFLDRFLDLVWRRGGG